MWRIALVAALALAACSPDGGEEVSTTPPEVTTSTTSTPATATTATTTMPTTAPTVTTTTVPALEGLAYATIDGDVAFPMILVGWTDELSLVGLRDGRIHSFDGTALSAEPLADLEVSTDGERGLLGLASGGPDQLFVHYSDLAGDTVVAELTLSTGDERVLLTVDQPASNHNGGMLQFGPDGMLYVGLGDGGGADDRFGHGQNTDTLLGGIVRIDPASGESELWSYGLRNPYRFWFDGSVLYVGDVGQNAYEEIDVVEFTRDGYNFGWPITEALHCFSPRSGCDTDGITLPVLEFEHGDAGACSVTGGVVYRGEAIPELQGHYLYSDYCGGWLRSFRFDGVGVTEEADWTDDVGVAGNVVSFGVDHAGEVYVLTTGTILRLEPVR